MISYVDLAFLMLALIMVLVNAHRGLLVALLGMVRFIIIVPLSYFLVDYVEPYVPPELFSDIPDRLKTVILFAACLILLLILSQIILIILKKLQADKDMPLRNTNAFLGGLFGLVKALIIIFCLSTLIGCLLEILPQSNEYYDVLKNSYVIEFANNINPLNIGGLL